MARSERESERSGRLVGIAETSRDCRMVQASAKTFKHTGPAEKERVASVPQREQLASMPEPPLLKRKGTEPSVLSSRS